MERLSENQAVTRILFVCLGNICRSPMAEGVFRKMAGEAGILDRLIIDSSGTSDYHAGHAPDPRAQRALIARGIDISDLRARKVTPQDFETFDMIFAMDQANLDTLLSRADEAHHHKIKLFLELAPQLREKNVPDPYFGGEEGFSHALALIESASRGLIDFLKPGEGA